MAPSMAPYQIPVAPWSERVEQIMAVPKRKHSNSRTGKRRSHDAKRPRELAICSGCSRQVPTHVICPHCGTYMGRRIIELEESAS